jgi:hypothetical protein
MTDTDGMISVDVTETCWAKVTVQVDAALLGEHGCADITEFCLKIRSGEINIFDLNVNWDEPYDSQVEDVDYQFAAAFDAEGNQLEVPDG